MNTRKHLGRQLGRQLEDSLLQFISEAAVKAQQEVSYLQEFLASLKGEILSTIFEIFGHQQHITTFRLSSFLKQYTSEPFDLEFWSKGEQEEGISFEKFMKTLFGIRRNEITVEEGTHHKCCGKVEKELSRVKVARLMVIKSKNQAWLRKGRDVLLKMVSQNAGVLWNILDSEGKGYIVFDSVSSLMAARNRRLGFKQWCSFVKSVDQLGHEVLEKGKFIDNFLDGNIDNLVDGNTLGALKQRQPLSTTQTKIRENLIPKDDLNHFANNYLRKRLQKPILSHPRRSLSVSKKGYTQSSHHVKLAW